MPRALQSVAVALALAACAAPAGTAATSAPAASTAPTSAPATHAPTATPVAAVNSGPALPVLGTENFYADLLKQIGGSRVTAESLLNDPNADPHEFEASPKAAKAVADAKLVIVNDIGYDDFMQKLLGASSKSDRIVINVKDVLGVKDDVNAHVWYDPATMPKVADAATAALSKLDPQNAAYFAAQKAAYLGAFKPFTDKVAALKAKYTGAPVAFTEPVAEYLADAMGLVVKTPEGFMKAIEQGTDPAPADVAAERDLLTGKKVKVLFYNSQVTTPLTSDIKALAEKSGVPVVGVAETIPPEFKTYQEWMLAQLDALDKALSK
ncbi:MAG TPA: zinc ABC transporter substrate-binding protein [Candidatus Limnocylindria bacterium]